MKNLIKKLTIAYYYHFVAAIIEASLLWYFLGNSVAFEPNSPVGKALQYITIIYVILSVPLSLYGFKMVCDKKLKLIEDEQEQLSQYGKYALIRIFLIGFGFLLGIFSFYFLGGYTSMIWCAAVAAVAFYFCKPSELKIQQELGYDDSSRF